MPSWSNGGQGPLTAGVKTASYLKSTFPVQATIFSKGLDGTKELLMAFTIGFLSNNICR